MRQRSTARGRSSLVNPYRVEEEQQRAGAALAAAAVVVGAAGLVVLGAASASADTGTDHDGAPSSGSGDPSYADPDRPSLRITGADPAADLSPVTGGSSGSWDRTPGAPSPSISSISSSERSIAPTRAGHPDAVVVTRAVPGTSSTSDAPKSVAPEPVELVPMESRPVVPAPAGTAYVGSPGGSTDIARRDPDRIAPVRPVTVLAGGAAAVGRPSPDPAAARPGGLGGTGAGDRLRPVGGGSPVPVPTAPAGGNRVTPVALPTRADPAPEGAAHPTGRPLDLDGSDTGTSARVVALTGVPTTPGVDPRPADPSWTGGAAPSDLSGLLDRQESRYVPPVDIGVTSPVVSDTGPPEHDDRVDAGDGGDAGDGVVVPPVGGLRSGTRPDRGGQLVAQAQSLGGSSPGRSRTITDTETAPFTGTLGSGRPGRVTSIRHADGSTTFYVTPAVRRNSGSSTLEWPHIAGEIQHIDLDNPFIIIEQRPGQVSPNSDHHRVTIPD